MNFVTDLPSRIVEALKRETSEAGLRWAGRPDPWHAFRGACVIWLFALPWTAFSVAWMLAAAGLVGKTRYAPINYGFVAFGLPFVLIGFAMMAAPFFAARTANATGFALTNDRLISVMPGWRDAIVVKTVLLSDIVGITRTEKPDGSGTLKLHHGYHRDSDGDLVKSEIVLLGIKDVREVERLLSSRQQRDSRPA